MSLDKVGECTATWWTEVCKKVKRAEVFIDAKAAECLHWNGGLLRLLDVGATSVREFASHQSAAANQKKAVFIVTAPLLGKTVEVLRDIVCSSRLEYCVVVTAAHPSVHQWARYGGRDSGEMTVWYSIEEQILYWMGNMNYCVELFYCPLYTAQVCPYFFVTPPFEDLFPLMESDVPRIRTLHRMTNKVEKHPLETLPDVDFLTLPMELQLYIHQFVNCFHSLLQHMNAKEDIFTVGRFSHIIGMELEGLQAARNRRKTATNKVSFLLIDRTLDLVGPSSHNMETLMDKAQALLPRLPGHGNDVAVNMSPLCSARMETTDAVALAPGCLADQADTDEHSLLTSYTTSKLKDSLLLLNRKLVEAATKKEGPHDLGWKPGRVTADTLESHVKSFRSDKTAVTLHSGVLQKALAAVQVMKHPDFSKLDQLLSIEKLLLQNLSDSESSSVLTQITQLVKMRKNRSLKVEDIFLLLVHLYSLAGRDVSIDADEENRFRGVLSEALLQDQAEPNDVLQLLVGDSPDEMVVYRAVRKLFVKLKAIAEARKDLKKYRSVFEKAGPAQPACYMGILKQILDDILDPERPELRDVEYRSAGMMELLKSGFSLFMNVSKPHPCDNPLLIIYVIGGVTATEVRQIKDTVSAAKSKPKVLVGSTKLLQPMDLLQYLLITDVLHEPK